MSNALLQVKILKGFIIVYSFAICQLSSFSIIDYSKVYLFFFFQFFYHPCIIIIIIYDIYVIFIGCRQILSEVNLQVDADAELAVKAHKSRMSRVARNEDDEEEDVEEL